MMIRKDSQTNELIRALNVPDKSEPASNYITHCVYAIYINMHV